ncbi:hypothetical protein [Lysinibacillus xylanilyticus]|uniref:hypothetical protein n=1 Tax=Lysinibacillus xylanilyticus TaxID=582475 RepID=UPI003CFCD659
MLQKTFAEIEELSLRTPRPVAIYMRDSGKCFLRESEAAAANVFCAKAKRQRQIFSARKRSGSGKCFLRESEATAANIFCAKAKRQRQMFSARKRSDSGKCFLRESEATAANVFCAKAKRQRQLCQGKIDMNLNCKGRSFILGTKEQNALASFS